MQEAMTELISMVATVLEDHINNHPYAADSLEGIQRWWLSQDLTLPERIVELALEKLVDKKIIKKTVNADGRSIYAKTSAE